MNNNLKNKEAEELVISFRFPPLTDVSGIVLSKRIINSNKYVDVIQGPLDESVGIDKEFNEIISKYIDKRTIINTDEINTWDSVEKFIREGFKEIEKSSKNYKTVMSRAWAIESHFLALYYKFKNPQIYWIAEFSDPIQINMKNLKRSRANKDTIKDNDFYIKINEEISKLNKKIKEEGKYKEFKEIKKDDKIYFLVEYLTFLFADEIIFTNKNQQKIMLGLHSDNITEYVMNKSEIKKHPTLSKEYYYINKSNYKVDEEYINIGYFGTYYGGRNLNDIFYAFESIEDDLKDKVKFHIFTQNPKLVDYITKDLKVNKIVLGNELAPLLKFLNLCTKFDILIVNDAKTKNYFEINPYLPSKIADYLGSGSDIWGICEEGSIIDGYDLKYKSYVDDYQSTKNTLIKILKERGIEVNENELTEDEFIETRIKSLNTLKFKEESINSKINDEKNTLINKLKEMRYGEVELSKEYKGLSKYYTCRLDVKNFGDENNSVNIIENSDIFANIKFPDWFKNEKGDGATIESKEGEIDLKIKCINNGTLKITLRGLDVKDKNNTRFPVYIDYTSLKINDEEQLEENILVWHDEPYIFEKEVKHDETITIHAEWKPFTAESTYNNKLKKENKQLQKAKKENKQLQKQLQKAKKENKQLKNTKSWKITKPLRKITNKFR